MRILDNGSCLDFTDFLIPILSQTVVAPALRRFLKSLISFKEILDNPLLNSSVFCFSRNASADRSDGIASFFFVFSKIFLDVSLYYSHSHL